MEGSKRIGERLKTERERQGITFDEVYTRARIHPGVVHDLEEGRFGQYSHLYVKSFLKKYAEMLGLDGEEILAEYEGLKNNIEYPQFHIEEKTKRGAEEKKKKKKERHRIEISPARVMADVRVQAAAAAMLGVLLVILLFALFSNIRGGIDPVSRDRSPYDLRTRSADDTEDAATAARGLFRRASRDVPSAGVSTLILEADQRVWLEITDLDEDGKVMFDGFMNEGDRKTLDISGRINIWTGKAEALKFILDSNDLGKITAGVKKHIVISPGNIRVGEETVFPREQ